MVFCFIHLAVEGEEMNADNTLGYFSSVAVTEENAAPSMSKPGECLKCKDFYNQIHNINRFEKLPEWRAQ